MLDEVTFKLNFTRMSRHVLEQEEDRLSGLREKSESIQEKLLCYYNRQPCASSSYMLVNVWLQISGFSVWTLNHCAILCFMIILCVLAGLKSSCVIGSKSSCNGTIENPMKNSWDEIIKGLIFCAGDI